VTSSGLVHIANGAVGLLGAIALMAFLDIPLLLATVAVLAVIGGATTTLMPRIARATERAQGAVGDLGASLERSLGAIRTVKASGAEAREIARLDSAADAAYAAGLQSARYQAIVGASTGLLVQVSFLTVLGIGGARVASGTLAVADLIAFLLYLFYLSEPIAQLAQGATQLQGGVAAIRRLGEIERLETEPADEPAAARQQPPGPAVVSFDRVSFAYAPDAPPALDAVSFTVPDRGLTAIVGPSGAGKTTVFALLERFYEPTAGTIRLAGVDLRDWPREALRGEIAYVEQEAPVLAGTLADNLRYAAPGAGDAALARVLADTRLDGLVARLPAGLETEVGSRGIGLSGGERQRIAIARALLRSPRLLLLDEATSQLDAVNEQALRDLVTRLRARPVRRRHRPPPLDGRRRRSHRRSRGRSRPGHRDARGARRRRRPLPPPRAHAARRCGVTARGAVPVAGGRSHRGASARTATGATRGRATGGAPRRLPVKAPGGRGGRASHLGGLALCGSSGPRLRRTLIRAPSEGKPLADDLGATCAHFATAL
jgi:ABC-type multidrug transport system fused ATPase/permease subunit